MHVALTGASGFIGSSIARRLADAGHSIAALVRRSSRTDHIKPYVARFVRGEQDDPSCWSELLEAADCVIHNSVDWRAYKPTIDLSRHLKSNLAASIELLERSGSMQFIFMSTIAVHHDMRPRWDGMIDEDHPTRPGSLYGAYKAAVEAHLWASHFRGSRSVCALRPCGVYGIDPNLDRSIGFTIIEELRKSRRFSRPGGGKFVHVDDVAAAVVACVGNADASGKVYNLADCYARWGDWAVMVAEALGIDAEIDLSSPASARNKFSKDAARTLGVNLDRGHEGIGQHIRELIQLMS